MIQYKQGVVFIIMIDLHCHSHFSDGLHSPADLVAKAINAGLVYFALTDHDSVSGYSECLKTIRPDSLCIIPGIELSTTWLSHDVHVLGLGIDIQNDALTALLHRQTSHRIARAREIGMSLESCGITDAYEHACGIAGHERIGRAHYAQLLIQKGYVSSIKAAFSRYLGRGKIAYRPSCWIDLAEAVAVIVEAGGQAVLAHPLKYKLTRLKLLSLLQTFKQAGGVGMEVVSGDMIWTDIHKMATLCQEFGLLASTGSDFHGTGLSRIGIGQQKTLPSTCEPISQIWTASSQKTFTETELLRAMS